MNRKPVPYPYGNPAPSDRNLAASVIEQRPPLAEGVGTCFATDHNMGAALEWLAHVEAGRIAVR